MISARFIPLALLLAAAPMPGASLRDVRFAPVMLVIPAGEGVLGSTEAETTREGRAAAAAAAEHPQRRVAFLRPFALGRSHVTVREFARFAKDTHRPMDGCVVALDGKWSDGPQREFSYANPGFRQRGDEPAVCVDWADASAYAAWLSLKTSHRYRLPTEAEWEYAARGGTTAARWWGDGREGLCQRANGGDSTYAPTMPADATANLTCADGYARTNPVRHFAPNPFGLHDMLGNAWQWTGDCFGGEEPCKARTIRGGSWHNGPAVLRSATRFSLPPTMRSSSLGFRVLRELP